MELINVVEWLKKLIKTRQEDVEMVYQLGKNGVRKFTKTLLALEERDYKTASCEMLDSRWHSQTPERCKQLSKLMEYCQ